MTRFAFGKNWAEYATRINEERIAAAQTELQRLVGDLQGRRFLDIGSGSGLHSLAAIRMGAAEVVAFDYDQDSVATTRKTLERHAPGKNWSVRQGDILAEDGAGESFDVVYSWGVLHHTGDMWAAVKNAANHCAHGGTLAIALYQKTPSCGLWTRLKRLYVEWPVSRPLLTVMYCGIHFSGMLVRGQNPLRRVREYSSLRGMSYYSDVKDWLGGYPYESVAPDDVADFLRPLGFKRISDFSLPASRGILGTGCGEWVFKRNQT